VAEACRVDDLGRVMNLPFIIAGSAFAGSFFGARVKLSQAWLRVAEQLADRRAAAAVAAHAAACPNGQCPQRPPQHQQEESSMRTSARLIGRVALFTLPALLLVVAGVAFAQDAAAAAGAPTPEWLDPVALINALPLPPLYKALALFGFPILYVVVGVLRGKTDPSSRAGKVIRFILDGTKHPSELPSSSAFARTPEEAKAIAAIQAPGGATPGGFARVYVLVALAITAAGVLAASAARADDVQPAPAAAPLSVCFDARAVYCLRPGAAFTGAAYDLTSHTVVRSFQFTGLYMLTLPAGFGVAAGAAFTSGDVQGLAAVELVTLPVARIAVGVSELLAGSRSSVALTVGTAVAF
jgi:hypothetical protein